MGRILILLLVTLPACTALDVKVEIFNPSGITSNDALESAVKREAANHAYLLKTDLYERTAVDLKSQSRHLLSILSSAQCPDRSKVIADGDLPSITGTAMNNVENAIREAVRARNAGMALLRQAETVKKDDEPSKNVEKTEKLTTALTHFSTGNKALSDLSDNLQQTFNVYTNKLLVCLNEEPSLPNLELLNKVTTSQRQTQTSIEQKLVSLTGGAHLLDDPLAPIVIAAPNAFWKGVYNETTALGTMGNTDIAIKMETVGTFTIKGLRVDASKVTEASFDVLKQSIRMVAAAYGVPLPATEKKPQQDSSGSATDILMTTDEIRQSADRKRLLSKTAALTLLDLIVAQRSDLTSSSTRKTAIQNLKHSFEAYKGQLAGN
ncbi:MAG: hypothetical protein CV089_03255 [Nitrospira sp. WS110]|nr:hypothetical protein [Nitrospira sp. WS110]